MSDDLPEWARPLEAGPIIIDENTPEDVLTDALAERLGALMRLYDCDATPEGWRRLALRLALDHTIAGKPVMEIVTPADRPAARGGAEPGVSWALAQRLLSRSRKLGSTKAAAEEIGRREGHNPATLQNIASLAKARRLKLPRWMQRWPFNRKIEAALATAAARLER